MELSEGASAVTKQKEEGTARAVVGERCGLSLGLRESVAARLHLSSVEKKEE